MNNIDMTNVLTCYLNTVFGSVSKFSNWCTFDPNVIIFRGNIVLSCDYNGNKLLLSLASELGDAGEISLVKVEECTHDEIADLMHQISKAYAEKCD